MGTVNIGLRRRGGIVAGNIVAKNIVGHNITVTNGSIIVDGRTIIVADNDEIIEIHGNVDHVQSDRSVEVTGDVLGNIEASGSIRCKNVSGYASADGSINCDDIGVSAKAGGSIKCDDIKGSAQAGGSIKCGKIFGDVSASIIR
jgi:cytoskeletal protein CcmA (bactofilin family)